MSNPLNMIWKCTYTFNKMLNSNIHKMLFDLTWKLHNTSKKKGIDQKKISMDTEIHLHPALEPLNWSKVQPTTKRLSSLRHDKFVRNQNDIVVSRNSIFILYIMWRNKAWWTWEWVGEGGWARHNTTLEEDA